MINDLQKIYVKAEKCIAPDIRTDVKYLIPDIGHKVPDIGHVRCPALILGPDYRTFLAYGKMYRATT